MAINDMQTIEECDRTVMAFQNDKKYRVLLLSNVGSVDLNLTATTVVVLFMSPYCCDRAYVNLYIGSMLVKYTH